MEGSAAVARRPHHRWIPWAIALLWIAAIGITVAASMLHAHDSAALYRFWSSLPGIVDICGTPTLLARSIPPALAVAGVGLTFLLDGDRRVVVAVRVAGLVLAAALVFAVMQNAELGVQQCIVD